jgi:hypothetical protein
LIIYCPYFSSFFLTRWQLAVKTAPSKTIARVGR